MILIYEDEGVDQESLFYLDRYIRGLFGCPVDRVTADDLINGDWQSRAKILIIGGGADVYYHRKLSGIGCDNIRNFVNHGGIYVGICAGAYFGTSKVEFEIGTDIEVNEARELKFFSGVSTGACLKRYVYNSYEGACSARIRLADKSIFYSYYNGGCRFEVEDDNTHGVRVLGGYADLGNRPAIIKCDFGKGYAILSGVHFEYPSELSPDISLIAEDIKATETVKDSFIKGIFAINNN